VEEEEEEEEEEELPAISLWIFGTSRGVAKL
jgi:hypothetical protein